MLFSIAALLSVDQQHPMQCWENSDEMRTARTRMHTVDFEQGSYFYGEACWHLENYNTFSPLSVAQISHLSACQKSVCLLRCYVQSEELLFILVTDSFFLNLSGYLYLFGHLH